MFESKIDEVNLTLEEQEIHPKGFDFDPKNFDMQDVINLTQEHIFIYDKSSLKISHTFKKSEEYTVRLEVEKQFQKENIKVNGCIIPIYNPKKIKKVLIKKNGKEEKIGGITVYIVPYFIKEFVDTSDMCYKECFYTPDYENGCIKNKDSNIIGITRLLN